VLIAYFSGLSLVQAVAKYVDEGESPVTISPSTISMHLV
jgi:hypothetical protein